MTQPGRPGRRSAAARSVFPIARHGPPAAPESISEPAAAVWHRIVTRFHARWFEGSQSLLECYCEIVVIQRQLSAELAKCSIESERYAELLRLLLQVASSLCMIATKLRITPQSSRDSRHTKLASPPPPWERDGDDVEVERVIAGASSERNFSTLLQQERARRGPHATLAATEMPDAIAVEEGSK